MNINSVRKHALSLEATTEEPHHQYSSFRVRGKIFVTIPPDGKSLHIFVGEEVREQALAMHPEFLEKLFWGGKAQGLRVALDSASPAVVKSLVNKAYNTRVSRMLVLGFRKPEANKRNHDLNSFTRFDPDLELSV